MSRPSLKTFDQEGWTGRQLLSLYGRSEDPKKLEAHIITRLRELSLSKHKVSKKKSSKKVSKKKSTKKKAAVKKTSTKPTPNMSNFQNLHWTTPQLCALFEKKRWKGDMKRLIVCDREKVLDNLRALRKEIKKRNDIVKMPA